MVKAVYKGSTKGWYQSDNNVISEECLGDWSEPAFTTAWGVKHKIHRDFWSVNAGEVKGAIDGIVDVVYKNAEVCQLERIGDDFKSWCLENPRECMFNANFEELVFDNAVDLFASFFDLFKIMIKDDSCYSDMEQMAEIERIFADIGSLSSSTYGFDYKWDQSIERKHIKTHHFFKELKQLYKEIPHSFHDIIKMEFPELSQWFKKIFHEIHETFAVHFKPRHHNKPTQHHDFHLPHPEFKMPEFPHVDFDGLFKPFHPTHHRVHHNEGQHHEAPRHHGKTPFEFLFPKKLQERLPHIF